MAFPVTQSDILLQKLAYIHNNNVRLGLADTPEEWTLSSTAWYSTGSGIFDIDTIEY